MSKTVTIVLTQEQAEAMTTVLDDVNSVVATYALECAAEMTTPEELDEMNRRLIVEGALEAGEEWDSAADEPEETPFYLNWTAATDLIQEATVKARS